MDTVELIARALWHDHVMRVGFPNGLPTWDEMQAHDENRLEALSNAEAVLEALRPALRRVVDVAWNEAFEDESVPATEWADRMIDAGLAGEKISEARGRWRAERIARLEQHKDT